MHGPFEIHNVAKIVSDEFRKNRKVLYHNGATTGCIETVCRFGIRRVKNNINSSTIRDGGRSVTITQKDNKVMKKDGSSERYVKRKKGEFDPAFVHIIDKFKYI